MDASKRIWATCAGVSSASSRPMPTGALQLIADQVPASFMARAPMETFEPLGIAIDATRNAHGMTEVQSKLASVRTMVVPTDEELSMLC